MDKVRILAVDDNPRIRQLLQANLSVEGYEVSTARDGAEALAELERRPYDLVILDLMLPKKAGYEVARRIREVSAVPRIMLTARNSEADIVRGFDAGADDYLTKPFSVNELIVRVRAVIRRTKFSEEIVSRQPLVAGEITIDLAQHRVLVRGQEVSLTPLEYRLLTYLASNQGRVMLHEDILRHVWGPEYREESEYLRVYVRYLRQKIERDPSKPKYIITKPGAGYMFQAAEESASKA